MGRKRQCFQAVSFESDPNNLGRRKHDSSANIYHSMIISKAWKELSPKQKELYTCCKDQFYGVTKPIKDNKLSFTMNQEKWCNEYGLYQANNYKGFQRDMAQLINLGFIKCLECGEHTRTKNIYAFSDMWRKYGTSEFKISANDKTDAMRRAARNNSDCKMSLLEKIS